MFQGDWDLDEDFLKDVDEKSDKYCSQVENQETQPKRRKAEGFYNVFSSVNDNSANKNMTEHNNKELGKNFVRGMFNKNTSEKSTQDKVVENTNNLKLQKVEVGIKGKANNLQQEYVLKNNQVKFQSSIKDKQSSSENLSKELSHIRLKQQSISNVEIKSNLSASKLPQVQANEKMTLVRRFPGPAGLLPDNIDVNILPPSYLNSLEEIGQTKEPSDADLLEYCSQISKSLFTGGAWQLMLNELPDGFLKGYEIATIKRRAKAEECYSIKANFLAGIVEHIDHTCENPLIVLKDSSDSIKGIIHKDILLKYPGSLQSNVVVLLHNVGLLNTSGSFISSRYYVLVVPSNLLAIYFNDGKIQHTQYMESVLESVSNGKVHEGNKKKEQERNRILTKALEEQSSKNLKHKLKYANTIKEKTNLIKHATDSSQTSSNLNTNLNETFDDMDELLDFDYVDDSFFSVPFDAIPNSEEDHKNIKQIDKQSKQQITKKFSEKEKENVHDDSQQSSENFKRFSSNIKAKEKFSQNLKYSQIDVKHHTPQVPARTTHAYLKEVKPEKLNNTFRRKLNTETYNINTSECKKEPEVKRLYKSCQNKVESVQFNTHKERNSLSIQSKLKKFTNTNVLTQPQNSESGKSLNQKEYNKMLEDKKLPKNKSSLFDIFCSAENDSDDEVLSQLDIDTLSNNYNDKN